MRGSTPCPCEANSRYGGNTACVALEVAGEDPIILDIGTGLRMYGDTQPHDGYTARLYRVPDPAPLAFWPRTIQAASNPVEALGLVPDLPPLERAVTVEAQRTRSLDGHGAQGLDRSAARGRDETREVIVNLRAPVVIDLAARCGSQLILPDETLPVGAPLRS